jgi:uncharacterized iron-regulated membrane protein
MSTTGPLIGMIISIAAVLGLSISMYWAAQTEVTEMRNTTVPNYIQVNTRNETVSNRVPVTAVPSKDNVATWGDIPGNFESTYNTKLNIVNYQADTLSSAHVSKMLKRV